MASGGNKPNFLIAVYKEKLSLNSIFAPIDQRKHVEPVVVLFRIRGDLFES